MSSTTLIDAIYPLSPAQNDILFHGLREKDSGLYLNQDVFEIRGLADPAVLVAAWRELTVRHDVLRTAFDWGSTDRMLQVVRSEADVPVQSGDWSSFSESQQWESLRRFLEADRAIEFDLAAPPLVRIASFRLAAERFWLVLTFHQLILDGWSLSLLLSDFFAFLRTGGEAAKDTKPSPRPYREYINWIYNRPPTEAERFWRKSLKGISSPTPLPMMRTAKLEEYRSADCIPEALSISNDLTASIISAARRMQVTVNTMVQGAWALVLAQLSGAKEVIFGATLSDRPAGLPGADRMVGVLINTLPVCARIIPDISCEEWFGNLQREQAEASQNAHTPLTSLHEWSEIPQGLPLFESVLIFENYPTRDSGHDLSATQVVRIDVRLVRAIEKLKYPLTIAVHLTDVLVLQAQYRAAYFDSDSIRRLLAAIKSVLLNVAEDPSRPVTDVGLCDALMRAKILAASRASRLETSPGDSLAKMFEDQVERTPQDPAIFCGGRALSCGALDKQSNFLANRLRHFGAGPERAIAVLMDRQPAMISSILAVLKTGAPYLPLDLRYPPERMNYILNDARPLVVLADRNTADSVPDGPWRVLVVDQDNGTNVVDQDNGTNGRSARSNLGPPFHPESLAYILYTSGSTGKPKGVAISHRSVAALVRWSQSEFTSDELARVLACSSICFDASVFEIFVPLTTGGTIVLVSDALALGDLAPDHMPTLILTVPSAIAELCREGEIPAAVKVMNLGGEVLPPRLVQEIHARSSVARVCNMYGPTEDTVCSTLWHCNRDDNSASIPIGVPISGTQAYVLSPWGHLLPTGAEGELFIGGMGLAREYFGQPALTAEKFVPNPFSDRPGSRVYRTGDIVRRTDSGALEFLGRRDHQVKVRGFRVELGEIEAILRQHECVQEVAVVVDPPSTPMSQLIAYVVCDKGRSRADASALSIWLKSKLPDYMIPNVWVLLDRFPLTSSGKVDRTALPAPQKQREFCRDKATSRSPTEEIIAGIWQEALSSGEPALDDDFFALGGHSLLGTQLVSRIRRVFGVDLPLRTLWDHHPTVRGLARRVAQLRTRNETTWMPDFEPVDRTKPLLTSFAQQRLWFLHGLKPDSPIYNTSYGLRFHGMLDRTALTRSISEIFRRHEVFSTTFKDGSGIPVQEIHPFSSVVIPEVDASAATEEQLHTLIQEERTKPFNLSSGPLFRILLIGLGQLDHILLLTVHHIIWDAWSAAVFNREFRVLYESFRSGDPAHLEDLATQYCDFAAWQSRWMNGGKVERELAHWETVLTGVPQLKLPLNRTRRAGAPPYRAGEIKFSIAAAETAKLIEFCRGNNITLFMLLLAAFACALRRYGNDDMAIGTVIANRTRVETEPLIGFFVNQLALRVRLEEGLSGRELLDQVRETVLAAFDHQDLPFEKVVARMLPDRDPGRDGLFQVVLTLQNTPYESLQLPDLQVTSITTAAELTPWNLNLVISEAPEGLVGSLVYSAELLDREMMMALIEQFKCFIGVLQDLNRTVSEIPLVTPSERQLLLAAGTASPAGTAHGVHELIAERCESCPDSIALVFEGEHVSYSEMNVRANRLAHLLRDWGIGPEIRVALFLDRGPDVIVSILAVLKAGGAYVPLDSSLPIERLAFMIDTSQVAVILSHERLRDRLPHTWAQVWSIDADWEQAASKPATNPVSLTSLDNLAYVIYTSGSTGLPKPVAATHRGLANLATSMSDRLGISSQTVLLQFNSYSFDAMIADWVTVLSYGGRLVLATRERLRPGSELVDIFVRESINTVMISPSVLATLPVAPLAGLRNLLVAGEECPMNVAAEWSRNRIMRNGYGPTEFTVLATMSDPIRGAVQAPIGAPIRGVSVLLLDEQFRMVPLGTRGEIFLSGTGLTRGYLNDPALTASRFLPNPFSANPGERMYQTGDWAEWTSTGSLVFRGRADRQVKIRGYRVELGEIEAQLNGYAGVSQAAVTIGGTGGEKKLIAFFTVARGIRIAGDITRVRVPDEPSANGDASTQLYRLRDGSLMAHRNIDETESLYNEIFARRVYLRHGIYLPKQPNVIDVGANIGMFTSFVLRERPLARVLAFEPIADTFRLLRENCERLGSGVEAFHYGLSDRDETVEFSYYPKLSGMSVRSSIKDSRLIQSLVARAVQNQLPEPVHSFHAVAEEKFEMRAEFCRLRRLSDVVREQGIETIDLLKIDVEGAEIDVLNGIDDLTWTKLAQIVVEVHPYQARTGEENITTIKNLVEARGFEVIVEEDEALRSTGLFYLYATYPARIRRPRTEPESTAAGPLIVSAQEFRKYLKGKLPEYMIPATFVSLDKMPTTSQAKVDTRALEAIDIHPDAVEPTVHATPTQELLIGIWQSLLGTDRIGLQDNFFELGGHSLLAAQTVARIRECFGVETPLRVIFDTPTIAALSEFVEDERHQAHRKLPPITPADRSGPIPLSSAQQRLWLMEQLHPGENTYSIPVSLRLVGELSVSALRSTLDEIVRRHEMLRTCFPNVEGGPVQEILPPAALPFSLHDYTAVPRHLQSAEVSRLIAIESNKRFNLATGPLLRASLATLSGCDHVLILNMHHVVADGWSLAILVREIKTLYSALRQNRPTPLPDPELHYADYSVWERRHLTGEILDQQLDYWRRELAEVTPLTLPADYVRGCRKSFDGSSVDFGMPSELKQALRTLCRREGVTLFMVLLAGVEILLGRCSGQEDFTIGTAYSKRDRIELEPIVGFFVNSLVLRADLSRNPTFRELLVRVRACVLNAYSHSDVSFHRVVAALKQGRELNNSPLFQVMFAFDNTPHEELYLDSLSIERLPHEVTRAVFDLAFGLSESREGIHGSIAYATDLFERETIEQLTTQYTALLWAAVADPGRRIQDLPLSAGIEAAKTSSV